MFLFVLSVSSYMVDYWWGWGTIYYVLLSLHFQVILIDYRPCFCCAGLNFGLVCVCGPLRQLTKNKQKKLPALSRWQP